MTALHFSESLRDLVAGVEVVLDGLGDRVERLAARAGRLRAPTGEGLPGRGDQLVVVPPGVGPLRAAPRLGRSRPPRGHRPLTPAG